MTAVDPELERHRRTWIGFTRFIKISLLAPAFRRDDDWEEPWDGLPHPAQIFGTVSIESRLARHRAGGTCRAAAIGRWSVR
jgi:hypothetical protein